MNLSTPPIDEDPKGVQVMNINYVICECDCQREQIAVKDLPDEDCNLWDRYNKVRTENEVCYVCGKLPLISVAYV